MRRKPFALTSHYSCIFGTTLHYPESPCGDPFFRRITQTFYTTSDDSPSLPCVREPSRLALDGPLVSLDIALLDHRDALVHAPRDGTEPAGIGRGRQVWGIVFQADPTKRGSA